MAAMKTRETRPTREQGHERLSPCVYRTLRMVSRAVTQLRVTLVSILATIARPAVARLTHAVCGRLKHRSKVSLLRCGGPQPPIAKMLSFEVDLI